MSLIRPKVADALSYLDQVKARFSNQNAIYNDFLDVMRQFKAQSIGTDVVIRRVRELFHGHPDLIVGFNTFIPQGYRLEGSSVYSRSSTESFPPASQTLSQADSNSNNRLPSFSAFRHPEGTSHEPTPTTLPYPQTSETTFYTPTVTHPPVLRSQLTTTETQPPQSHSYQRTVTPSNQNALDMVYTTSLPPQSQPPYISNVHQSPQSQSFSHAIKYVNQVKQRFQARPDIYKRFLEILQWYQREQENTDSHRRKQAEMQVFQDVAKLLNGHDDLLQEFSRFLPESTNVSDVDVPTGGRNAQYGSVSELSSAAHNRYAGSSTSVEGSGWSRGQTDSLVYAESKKLKRGPGASTSQGYGQGEPVPIKKSRQEPRDMSLSDLGISAGGPEASLLLRIRNALETENSGRFYQQLLQTLNLYNRKMLSEKHLMDTANTTLYRFPELSRQFYDMFVLPHSESGALDSYRSPERDDLINDDDAKGYIPNSAVSSPHMSESGSNRNRQQQSVAQMVAAVSELSQKRLDLDFTKLRVCGASYRMLPPNFIQPKCSGRIKSAIAREVLNNTYISFSSMNSEDSQFVTSKKNPYEDGMYHTEDERYEADMVMEVNKAALQNLVVVKDKMDHMNREDAQNFRLDDNLGGSSAILMKKALHRVYGDKAVDVIHGLKNCPHTVVPIVIQRMNQKEAEWSESLRKFQQHWGEQDSKNYLRSLDHQGNHFRNRDNHLLRPKAAICAIENIARGERAACTDSIGGDNVAAMLEKGLSMGSAPLKPVSPSTLGAVLNYVVEGTGENGSMHMTLEYPPPETCASLLQDVASLIIHHLKRQNTSKEDKRSMKYFMRTVLQDLFMQERFPMSDDEAEEDEDGHGGYLEEDATRREVDQPGGEEIDNKDGGATASISRRVRECPNQTESMEVDVSPAASEKGESRAQSRKHSRRKIVKGMTSQYKPSQGGPDDQQTPSGSQEEYYCFIMGNNHLYSFLRMHHLLFTRLFLLRTRAEVMQKEYREENRSNEQVSNILSLRKKDDKEPGEYYAMALNLVKEVLDGCEDAHTYEDRLRDMFGIYAYPWFTMDRIVMTLVKQLHAVTLGDEVSCRLTEEFRNYFKPSGSRSRNDSERIMEGVSEARFIPMSNDICGPVRTRYMRIRNEVKFQYSAFRLCIQQALSSNDEAEDDSNGEGNNLQGSLRSLPSAESIPNCYTFVMVRQASKLLIRLNDPNYMINTLNRSLSQDAEPLDYEEHKPSCSNSVSPLSPRTRVKAANAFKRAIEEEAGEIHSWYDYLARYLLIPGCWTAGPVSANLVAEVKPVFLYRNVRKYVKRLTNQAVARRMSEAIATIDPQPEEILLRSAEAGEGSSEQEDLEKDICVVMRRVLRNNLTRSEIFRDCYSSDCMQSSSKSLRSAGSTPKANTCKISWSVGSYGIFIRSKKNRPIVSPDRMPKAAEKFRTYQAKWLKENGNPEQIESITALFKRHSGCYDEEIQKSPALVTDQSDEEMPKVVVDQTLETNQTTIEPSIPEDSRIPTTSTTAVEVEKETLSTTNKEPKVEQMDVSSATE